MKYLLINRRKLAVIAGLIFSGLLVKTIDDQIPVNVLAGYINNETETTSQTVDLISQQVIEDYTEIEDTPVVEDSRVQEIRAYLSNRNAPLAEYAEEFVKAADEYGIDYRLVAAISVIESGGGKSCFKPYNAWGWGNATFDNFTDGIWTVSKGMSKYYQNGLDTPDLIAPRYCPPNAVKWANNVNYVMNLISA